jgi:hypothetical protein
MQNHSQILADKFIGELRAAPNATRDFRELLDRRLKQNDLQQAMKDAQDDLEDAQVAAMDAQQRVSDRRLVLQALTMQQDALLDRSRS